jgi:hypothetical protein
MVQAHQPSQMGVEVAVWGDTAGASVDPSDGMAILVTQAYTCDHRTFHHNK